LTTGQRGARGTYLRNGTGRDDLGSGSGSGGPLEGGRHVDRPQHDAARERGAIACEREHKGKKRKHPVPHQEFDGKIRGIGDQTRATRRGHLRIYLFTWT
jgi:hypothetical protein